MEQGRQDHGQSADLRARGRRRASAVAKALPALDECGGRAKPRGDLPVAPRRFRAAHGRPRRLARSSALGAYFGYVSHPFADESAVTVAERLAREAGIVTVPGSYFGTGPGAVPSAGFANADAATIALLGTRLPERF